MAEARLHPQHARVGECLAELAAFYHGAEDSITSEALFRSAQARFQDPSTAEEREMRDRALTQYSLLLSQLEWNGRLRTQEANDLLAKYAS